MSGSGEGGELPDLYAALGRLIQAGLSESACLLARIDGTGSILLANPACELAGKELWPTDARVRTVTELLAMDSRPRWSELLSAASSGSPGQAHLQLRQAQDDLTRAFRVWTMPLARGEIMFYAEPIAPLNEREALEYARLINQFGIVTRQVHKLLQSAQTVSQARAAAIAHLAHEVRNPLGGMQGLAEAIRDDPQTMPLHREFATVMVSSSEDVMQLLTTTLDHARLDAGRLELESVPIDLRAMIRTCLGLATGRLGSKPVVVHDEIDPAVPPLVRGDPTRLRQILANLITNAAKFTAQGSITVVVKVMSVEPDRVSLQLDVTDTGHGIPAEAQRRLFADYVQADATVQRHHGGSGLGLSLCRRLVEAMGGRIGVTSEVGVGSTFSIALTLGCADEVTAS